MRGGFDAMYAQERDRVRLQESLRQAVLPVACSMHAVSCRRVNHHTCSWLSRPSTWLSQPGHRATSFPSSPNHDATDAASARAMGRANQWHASASLYLTMHWGAVNETVLHVSCQQPALVGCWRLPGNAGRRNDELGASHEIQGCYTEDEGIQGCKTHRTVVKGLP